MPDIAMCCGVRCAKRNRCYRFTATPDRYQSYFEKTPWVRKDGKKVCEYFWNVKVVSKAEREE